jgi:hypothetical protein
MTLHAGFGTADITPALGVGLAGFGPFLQRRATRVHSPLQVSAMAVADGTGSWAITSCDLLAIAPDVLEQAWKLIDEQTGWGRDRVAIHATHNHSGPSAMSLIGWGEPDELYLLKLPRLIARAVADAIADLSPARLSHAAVPLDRFAHRRTVPAPGLDNAVGLAGEWDTARPDEIDREVQVFRLDSPDGRLRGIVSQYSCHPVVCCEQSTDVHGDFPGVANRLLEAEFPGVVALFLQGAHGDINPNYAHGPADESLIALDRFGRRYAGAVQAGLEATVPVVVDGVAVSRREVEFQLAPVDLDDLRRQRDRATRRALAGPLASPRFADAHAAVFAIGLDRAIAALERGEPTNLPLHARTMILGPFAFTGVNVELYHGIQRRHRDEFDERHLLLSTTDGWTGYAPTEEGYQGSSPSYAAYEVPFFTGQLPYDASIATRILDAARRTVAAARGQLE